MAGPFIAVSAGDAHTCTVTWGDGRLRCWGWNGYGQAPATVTGQFSEVSAGRHHTCGVQTSGSVKCWGSNWSGQAPASVAGSFRSVSAGSGHTCGAKTGVSVVCWGDSSNGSTTVPIALSPPPLTVALSCESFDYEIACGQSTSGGTAPYRVEWFIDGNLDATKTDQAEASFFCRRGVTHTVRVASTDASGATASKNASVTCQGTPF